MLLSELKKIEKKIKGEKLSDILNFNSTKKSLNKGEIGQLFETQIFNKKLDNKNEPDLNIFVDEYDYDLLDHFDTTIQVELKVSAAKLLKNGEFRAKERLKLSSINYNNTFADNFVDSNLYSKIRLMYLIYYLYEKDVNKENYMILTSFINNIDMSDISILERDYKIIISKIRNGEAHLLSGSDTFFLEACTSGQSSTDLVSQANSTTLAKRRSFALKNSYMSALLNDKLDEVDKLQHKETNDLIHIENKLNSMLGKTFNELKELYAPDIRNSKNMKSIVFRNALGVRTNNLNELSLFKKANIKFKTFNITDTCHPADGVNFFMVDWDDFATDTWEESKLYEVLNTKYFYCYFHKNKENGILTFVGYKFHGFTEEEIEMAKRDWDKARSLFLSGANVDDNLNLLTSKQNELFYIRTKGQTKLQSIKTYSNGQEIRGTAWWINNNWLKNNVIKPSVKLDLF